MVTKKITKISHAETWPFPKPEKGSKVKILKAKPAKKKLVQKVKPKTQVHSVKATISNFDLTKAGSAVNLEVFANKTKLGEIAIGSGSLYWTGRGRQISKRIAWPKFAEMMDKLAYGEK